MARDHGRVYAALLQDADWRTLPVDAQWLYLHLLASPQMTQAGVVARTPARWAGVSVEMTPARILAALGALNAARYVVDDADTEEVCVRSLIRRDKVFRQPNVLRAAADSLGSVQSLRICKVLLSELDRLPLDEVRQEVREAVAGLVESMKQALHARLKAAPPDPSRTLPEPSAEPPANGSRAHVGASAFPSHQPPATSRSAPPRASLTLAAPPATAQTLLSEHIDACRRRPPDRIVGQLAKQLGALLEEGYSAGEIRAALALLRERSKDPSVLPSLLNEVLNPPRPPVPRSTTADRVAQGLDVARRLAAQEAR